MIDMTEHEFYWLLGSIPLGNTFGFKKSKSTLRRKFLWFPDSTLIQ